MKITFLGTRGYIDIRTKKHYRHSSTLISYRKKTVMIDCGLDWEKKVFKINPDAIVITHAHPDHAFGLKDGSPCPVYATKESWQVLKNFKIKNNQKHIMPPRKKVKICGIIFETFPVIHSTRAPAAGYRITAGKNTIFYVPDLVYIKDRKQALAGAKLYIGDGATINRPMVRKKSGQLFGHTTISAQLTWCKKEDVPKMIVTHCGTQIVGAGEKIVTSKIEALAKARKVKVKIAYDGMEIRLR
jgi:ribonuclease BN (tRNA processing enzyme)